MRRGLPAVLAVIVCLAGLGVLLYPTISNWWNLWMQSRLISEYERKVEELDTEQFTEIYDAARIYNEKLYQLGISFANVDANDERLNVNGQNYDQLLNISGNGVMGYVIIDKIDVRLAISHGTEDAVLHDGVGHLKGSSLPVGGENTHAALFGHRGLPSAVLFTDLDQMEIGDYFQINILGRVLNYQVDQILVIEPQETDPLEIIEGKDYVTLVTCTPYAVNTHRLLIRGVRVEEETNSNE
ncbi:MAG: class C sortase [Lachnospiraceae bacterium]|nr:class C sortase [Lachnospiraceae bacterium]